MGFKVEYTDKAGKACSLVFGSELAARAYARNVKSAVVSPASVAAKVVEAKHCPVATPEMQRTATNAYFRAVKTPEVEAFKGDRDERMAEHFGAAALSGQSREDAWSDWDYISAR